MTKLEEMYFNYIESADYENGPHYEQVKRDTLDFYNKLDEILKPYTSNYREIEEVGIGLASSCEIQGFIYGFCYAMKLLKECKRWEI